MEIKSATHWNVIPRSERTKQAIEMRQDDVERGEGRIEEGGDKVVKVRRCGYCPTVCQRRVACCQWTWLVLLTTASILIMVMVPLSFVYFEHDEMGFTKHRLTNDVDTDTVHYNGRVYTGLDHVAVAFPRGFQSLTSRLAVFPSNGQEFHITIVMYYRLNPAMLAKIYAEFGTSAFAKQVETRANSAIKRVAPLYTIEEYITKREVITLRFFNSLFEDLATIGIILPWDKFYMGEVEIPSSIKSRNLDVAVQEQRNVEEENRRITVLVEKETSRQVEFYDGNITRINADAAAVIQNIDATAGAEIIRIKEVANAYVKRVIDEAKATAANKLATVDGDGLELLYTNASITTATVKTKYIDYFALLERTLDQGSN